MKRFEFGEQEIARERERESILSLETMNCVDALVKDDRDGNKKKKDCVALSMRCLTILRV